MLNCGPSGALFFNNNNMAINLDSSWVDDVTSYSSIVEDEMSYDPVQNIREDYNSWYRDRLFDAGRALGIYQSDSVNPHTLQMPVIHASTPELTGTITTHSAPIRIDTADVSRAHVFTDGVFTDGRTEVFVRGGQVVNLTDSVPYFTGSNRPQSLLEDDVDDENDAEEALSDLREELSMRIEEVDEDLRARVEELETIVQEQRTRISDLASQLSHIREDMRSMMDRLHPILRDREEEDYRRQLDIQRQRMAPTRFVSPERISQMRFDPAQPIYTYDPT